MNSVPSKDGTPDDVIPFNKPFIAGKELYYVALAVTQGNLGGDGAFTQACVSLLQSRLGLGEVLLTPSCTASLEMAASLCDIGPGDEVIMPSYTFVSTASAFVRCGGIPVFVDVRADTMNLDETLLESAITERTKAICVVHYAGVAVNMDVVMALAKKHNLRVIEDAAQAVNSFYRGKALGSIGDLGCFSFHETKNYICGEGGALCINRPELVHRAEILRDKGTNRQEFFRGAVDKYTWVDVGSSYVLSELCSAFLYGQLEQMDAISERRAQVYQTYMERLLPLQDRGLLKLPTIPEECRSNYHMFHVLFPTSSIRDHVLTALRNESINAVFHYVPLHTSPVGEKFPTHAELPNTEQLSARLLRLPFFHDLTDAEQFRVCDAISEILTNSDAQMRCGTQ